MPVSGAQDFWVVGARAYFKKTGSNPWRDLGIIQTVTPNLTTESIELEDPDGGVKTTADKKVTKITENYDLTISNLNVSNLSLMFLADDPTVVSIGAAEVTHQSLESYVGELFQILDAAGEPVRMTEIAAVFPTSPGATIAANDITAIDVATRTLTVSTDYSGSHVDGDIIAISPDGLADKSHAGTYTIDGTPASGSITVKETLGGTADEVAITVDLIHDASTPGNLYALGVDYAIVNEDRGLFRWLEHSNGTELPADGTDITVIYWQYAISGLRKFLPQATDSIEGALRLVLSRDSFAREDERFIPKCKVTPGSANFQIDDYSNFVLNFEVIADTTRVETVGHHINYKGAVPSAS